MVNTPDNQRLPRRATDVPMADKQYTLHMRFPFDRHHRARVSHLRLRHRPLAFPASQLNRHQRKHPGHKRERGTHCAYICNANAAYHGAAHCGAKRDADVKRHGLNRTCEYHRLGMAAACHVHKVRDARHREQVHEQRQAKDKDQRERHGAARGKQPE